MTTWRTGRTVGRTLYQQNETDPSKQDTCIGLASTTAYADVITRAVNGETIAPVTTWWAAGCLVYDHPGAALTSGWVAAMDTPELARQAADAVNGTTRISPGAQRC